MDPEKLEEYKGYQLMGRLLRWEGPPDTYRVAAESATSSFSVECKLSWALYAAEGPKSAQEIMKEGAVEQAKKMIDSGDFTEGSTFQLTIQD